MAGVRNTGLVAELVHRFQSVVMILTGYPPFSILDARPKRNDGDGKLLRPATHFSVFPNVSIYLVI